eukprot:347852_1
MGLCESKQNKQYREQYEYNRKKHQTQNHPNTNLAQHKHNQQQQPQVIYVQKPAVNPAVLQTTQTSNKHQEGQKQEIIEPQHTPIIIQQQRIKPQPQVVHDRRSVHTTPIRRNSGCGVGTSMAVGALTGALVADTMITDAIVTDMVVDDMIGDAIYDDLLW